MAITQDKADLFFGLLSCRVGKLEPCGPRRRATLVVKLHVLNRSLKHGGCWSTKWCLHR
jgi:hypothetical protein